ncbi:uncharacterized protein LOC121256512 [Juglans microcarpa x Juglans regia]|uniref:uncharacterized protein LOC121256512 n=1 Tax=Juglans microcarpa x Juglans regia TaxID=2249226 RepID=UPI001B7E3AD6|nr:uncharacterized protein LOC121256512 [Juglans microcarpa x Juglans regia]
MSEEKEAMDFWVVPALYGAGYIAEYWFSDKENEGASENSIYFQSGPRNQTGGNLLSDTANGSYDERGDLLIPEVWVGRGSRSRRPFRGRSVCGYFVKPGAVSPPENCVVTALLYRMEEYYAYTSVQSPTPTTLAAATPFLVSDGSLTISRGSPNGMLLFFLGITIGMMSTILAHKREAEKLNDQLKQTKQLVQDLHEEIEMKDLLTIKVLGNRDLEKKPDYGKTEDYVAISKIEAELEADLERLQSNMKPSSLETISNYVELDPDFVVDVVRGDLRPNKIHRLSGGLSDSDSEGNETSTNHTHTEYRTVSPKELSMRLHEVIQLRLEARIKELETAVEKTRKSLLSVESENMISENDLCMEKYSLLTKESRTSIDEINDMDGPSVINLSKQASDTYNEAEKGNIRMAITEEEAPLDTSFDSYCTAKELNPFDQNLFKDQIGDVRDNGSMLQYDINGDRWSSNSNHDEIRIREEKTSRSSESNDICESEDGDELEKFLIERIVEKTRQGSSVVLNAQRIMYSMHDQ